MMIRALTACLAIACLVACNTTPPAPADEADDDFTEEVVPATTVALIQPTAAMIEAARTNDPLAMAGAISIQACVPSSTCPAEFGSCANWSFPSECSFSCGGLCRCRFTPEGDCDPEIRGRSTTNAFRVCFDPNGNACTEWRQTFTSFCGC